MKIPKISRPITLFALILLVSTSSAFALPPDPDNAALLYYQAFLTYEKPDDTMKDMISDLANGKIEPNPRIAEFIESQKAVIKLAVAAAELPNCHWGLKYSEGLDMEMPYLSRTKHLTWLILADARTSAANGDYELAIDRCLTARKFAIQIVQEPTAISFLVAVSIERLTNKCIQDILSSTPIELETLQYLKAQLAELDNRFPPAELYWETERDVMAMYITPERIREVIPLFDDCGDDDPKFNDARELVLAADSQFCEKNMIYYNQHWAGIFSAFELPYEQAYNALENLDKKVAEELKTNPDATMTATLAPATQKIYNYGVRRKTFSNVIKTALEIYIIKAQTGRLPDALPDGLPKDVFSDKDFEYEKTKDTFILRCQGKDLVKDEIHQYEFNVVKK